MVNSEGMEKNNPIFRMCPRQFYPNTEIMARNEEEETMEEK
jgi:hypothetical protein